MVSGFLTSPCDHSRMSSAVARPMRSSSKKLTSSKISFFQRLNSGYLGPYAGGSRPPASASDLFDAARLAPRQVDPQLLGRPEDVLVGLAHLDRHAVLAQHLD